MTKIPWTNKSWNPIVGCSKVSTGCQNCYAEKMAYRLACMNKDPYRWVVGEKGFSEIYPKWNGETAFVESALEKPLHWKKPRMIFVCSMGDLFHESVPFEWIDKVMAVIWECYFKETGHIFQLLTKRPERMKAYFSHTRSRMNLCEQIKILFDRNCAIGRKAYPDIWLGVTAENQEMWDKRRFFLDIPAAVHFVSNEPLLSGIRYTDEDLEKLGWVIIGAESGSKRRECRFDWVTDLMRQCVTAGVPCFVKQIQTPDGKLIKNPEGFPQQFPKG